jgi:DNA replication protein DnaC
MTAQAYSPLRANFKDVSFETTELQGKDKSFITAYNRMKKYCENAEEIYKEGYGIYVYSLSPGVGKTHLLNCMAKELNKKYLSTLLISEGDILRAFKETFNKGGDTERKVIDRMTSVEFLFIDDIGTEAYNANSESKYIQMRMYDIVDRRYNSQKPTIFSSNYSMSELITRAGILEKTVDRINALSTAVLKIEGRSVRQPRKQNLF